MEQADRVPFLCYAGQTSDMRELPAVWYGDLEMKNCLPDSSIPLFFRSEQGPLIPLHRRSIKSWSPIPLAIKNNFQELKCRCKSKDECSLIRALLFLSAMPVPKHIDACGHCSKSTGPQAYTLRFGPAFNIHFKYFMSLPQEIRYMIYRLVVVNSSADGVIIMSRSEIKESPKHNKRCSGPYGAWLTCAHSYTTVSTYHPGNEHWLALRLVNKQISQEVTDQILRENEICLQSTTGAIFFLRTWMTFGQSLRSISLTGIDWNYGREFVVMVMEYPDLWRIRLEPTTAPYQLMIAAWAMKPWLSHLGSDKDAVDHICNIVTFGDCRRCNLSTKQGFAKQETCQCSHGHGRKLRKCWVGFRVLLEAQLFINNMQLDEESKALWDDVDGDIRTHLPG
ncbi:hypothetical protein KVT40_009179 [Elsinoe batatas]|uniref:Uncharacterized protein n=1 Tax=Elsinoe batatas TaxID=2601811 RepID=A0A8K0L1P4_9PEZI|nr:hypothetical protein KVT40_009179 [Elsinoe batatas]